MSEKNTTTPKPQKLLATLLAQRTRQPVITDQNRRAVTRSVVDELSIIRDAGNRMLNGWDWA